jgi:ATP-dependent protease HslVU (ClpYQ) ATPase subunit
MFKNSRWGWGFEDYYAILTNDNNVIVKQYKNLDEYYSLWEKLRSRKVKKVTKVYEAFDDEDAEEIAIARFCYDFN